VSVLVFKETLPGWWSVACVHLVFIPPKTAPFAPPVNIAVGVFFGNHGHMGHLSSCVAGIGAPLLSGHCVAREPRAKPHKRSGRRLVFNLAALFGSSP